MSLDKSENGYVDVKIDKHLKPGGRLRLYRKLEDAGVSGHIVSAVKKLGEEYGALRTAYVLYSNYGKRQFNDGTDYC